MSGSSLEPGETAVVPNGSDPPRPVPVAPFVDRWSRWRRDPRLVTGGLALVALIAGAWWVRVSVGGPPGALAATSRTTTTGAARNVTAGSAATRFTTTTTTVAVFVVDVVGAVRHAGVVSLPGSARVIDAVAAAGGALPGADLDRLNLAAHLVDGMRIAVPRRGVGSDPAGPTSDPAGPTSAPATGAGGTGGAPTPSTPLDLNTATEAQLETLPGIGPSLAQAIISERDREGGFHSVEDLRRVRGIGDVRFAQLRPLVTL
jgi:competence protein ComEA